MGNKIKINDGFFENFKSYLEQIGLNDKQIADIKTDDAVTIFNRADAADGKIDGQAEGEEFLAEIKKEFSNQTFNIEATEQAYLDAWEALAGNDAILEAKELMGEEEAEETSLDSANGGGGGNRTTSTGDDANQSSGVKAITADDLKDKNSSELREARNKVISDIDSVRSEMDAAVKAKQEDVEKKNQEYKDLLATLAEASEIKDENDKSLKDLQTDKTNKENEITTKNGEIDKTKSDISAKEKEISDLNSQLSSLHKPSESEFTTTNEDGETVVDTQAYQAALQQYNEQKEALENQIAEAEDALSQLELDLANKEKELQDLEKGLHEIENQIVALLAKIATEETQNAELADKVAEAMNAYDDAKNALDEVAKPYKETLETLNGNLEVYGSAIDERENEEAKEKEKWTSDVEGDEAKGVKDEIDELLAPYEPKEADESDNEEAEEKELSEEDKESLKTLLNNALSNKNISLEDKFRLLNYAKGKNEDTIREMLEDDTFFVNAFNEMADDKNTSTESVLAMQEAYFKLQGNYTIGSNDPDKNAEVKAMYTEGVVSALEKARGDKKRKLGLEEFSKYGITPESIERDIKASTEISDSDKKTLLNRLNEAVTITVEEQINDKLTGYGAVGDIKVTKNADGTYSATEKGDGFEASFTFDKDGNITTYTNAIGTFTAKGNSVVLTPNTTGKNRFDKWAKPIDSYAINANIEDIVASIKGSGPLAEKVINMDLNYYGSKERHFANNFWCVEYANDVLTQLGKPIGKLSDDVKANNQEVSWADARTGDVYNKERHVGIVLLNIVQNDGRRLVITGDHGSGKININIRDWQEDEKRSSLSNQTRFFKGVSG